MRILLSIISIGVASFQFCIAQTSVLEVLGSSGSRFANATGQINWTVGEVTTFSLFGSNNDLTQGFHQPITIITSLPETETSPALLFPNPFSTRFKIDLKTNMKQIRVYNSTGIEVYEAKPQKSIFQVNTEDWTTGAYSLIIWGMKDEIIFLQTIVKQ